MQLTNILALLSLSASTFALPTEVSTGDVAAIVPRDITSIKQAMQRVDLALVDLDTAILAITGADNEGEARETDEKAKALIDTLNAGTITISGSNGVNFLQANDVALSSNGIIATSEKTVNDLISKKALITKAGQEALLNTNMEAIYKGTVAFNNVLITKVPALEQQLARMNAQRILNVLSRGRNFVVSTTPLLARRLIPMGKRMWFSCLLQLYSVSGAMLSIIVLVSLFFSSCMSQPPPPGEPPPGYSEETPAGHRGSRQNITHGRGRPIAIPTAAASSSRSTIPCPIPCPIPTNINTYDASAALVVQYQSRHAQNEAALEAASLALARSLQGDVSHANAAGNEAASQRLIAQMQADDRKIFAREAEEKSRRAIEQMKQQDKTDRLSLEAEGLRLAMQLQEEENEKAAAMGGCWGRAGGPE
ncbi:hypothetical protein K402DRAFT_402667 [Aulographum hederae CBS 113979]|uniref:Uncharacterized protein n=1 Tax=Aulographum hederae CBS 113979 TaxID=1176131 RepID=A0A6G1H5X6_9PEZI|nr:hypothetical protein K402DRAFT_402667 [Aulographum hederae CBS 113979]